VTRLAGPRGVVHAVTGFGVNAALDGMAAVRAYVPPDLAAASFAQTDAQVSGTVPRPAIERDITHKGCIPAEKSLTSRQEGWLRKD
jgi:hypothetical protein